MYNVLFPHGAYKQKTTEDWVSDLDMTDESWLPTLLQTIHENENHSDEFWGQVEMNDEKVRSEKTVRKASLLYSNSSLRSSRFSTRSSTTSTSPTLFGPAGTISSRPRR